MRGPVRHMYQRTVLGFIVPPAALAAILVNSKAYQFPCASMSYIYIYTVTKHVFLSKPQGVTPEIGQKRHQRLIKTRLDICAVGYMET